MIYGIGTDIVEVVRIEESLTKFGDAFAQRILNASEWHEYEQSRVKARFLAKRFAAKEAFAKALGTGIRGPATFENIGISHDELGKPILVLANELQTLLNAHGIVAQHLSISDEKALAAAFVVLEKV
ncbi:holo-ACP synthase [Methylobacillus gramineus]|uniref:holo-ACP synthase n=1 Tax=Methylobacillus gramineus TaxID=755169 RepID=UPI001CFFE25A|nr:holo-ACP synthase [Methylobacillus gramineus]MCB5184791.1 holo-ACP synthase [Methylobacillus gramineus]